MMNNQIFAIDANILVYAYDELSPFHEQAKAFLIQKINTQINGKPNICICYQTCTEFMYSSTFSKLQNPLTLEQAQFIINQLIKYKVDVIYQKPTQLQTFLEIFNQKPSRKRLYDISLIATLKDNHINGIYTVNTKDFSDYPFLTVINPLI